MTVKELINELLEFDMSKQVKVSIDNENKIAGIEFVENWHSTPIIYFTDWRKKE